MTFKSLFGGLCRSSTACLLLTAGSAADAANWPTTRFEVYEGHVVKVQGHMLGETSATPAIPLTPRLSEEIASYLEEVALELQRDFPAPLYREPVIRQDGQSALRVYYYDIPGNDSYALYQYGANCDPERSYITLNPTHLSKNGEITPKGYIDMAHELFHAVQHSTRAFRNACAKAFEIGNWIVEGQAEAIAHDLAYKLRKVRHDNPQVRFGLRIYSVPLAITNNHVSDAEYRKNFAYQTSSFWRYMAERRHLGINFAGHPGQAGNLPGPDYYPNYGTDYSYLAELLSNPVASGMRSEIAWLATYSSGKFNTPLYRLYTEFIAVFTDYPRFRFKSSYTVEESAAKWRDFAFAPDIDHEKLGCSVTRLPARDSEDSVELQLETVATRCIDIVVGDIGAPLGWTVQVTADSREQLEQVRLAMAGGQQIVTSGAQGEADGKPVAAFQFRLEPAKLNTLLVTNVNREPQLTRAQTVTVHFSLEDNHNNLPADPASSVPSSADESAPPGPRGAAKARKRDRQKSLGQKAGAGTATLSRDAGGGCEYCNGETELILSSSPQFKPELVDAGEILGYSGQMMDFTLSAVFDPVAMVSNVSSGRVSISMPFFEYGFRGELGGARIKVPGNPDLAALEPAPEFASEPCVWNTPNGIVMIEKFTPLVLRGRYSADLVSTEIPRDSRKCPTKAVIQHLEGRFTVTAPWMTDGVDMSWIAKDQGVEIPVNSPEPEQFEPPPDEPASVGFNPLLLDSSASEDVDPDDCDCSCAGFAAAFKLSEQVMMSGVEPDSDGAMAVQCVGYCMADAIKEGCEIDF